MLLSQYQSIREIARRLSRAPSTISREIKRNGGLERYRIVKAEQRAWSPQQIAGWLKRQYPANHEMYVSHEANYKTLFIQTEQRSTPAMTTVSC